jgi:serine/threonine protein kinase
MNQTSERGVAMANHGHWQVIKELGHGGQGTVSLAKDTRKTGSTEQQLGEIKKAIVNLSVGTTPEVTRQSAQALTDAIALLHPQTLDPASLGALKVLYKPHESADYEKAKARLKQEVEVLTLMQHPNILRILDHKPEEGWFVGEYHSRGPLSKEPHLYKGDLLGALTAFRPLVEAVAQLHKKGAVHRDIKPQNVFIALDSRLVLGDFGIVFFEDSSHTRITDTYENVGSRDWMPGWAMGRIDDTQPSFDVFALGKLLWAMISGRSFLRLWYHHDPGFELEEMFRDDDSIRWARVILDACIVEREEQCLRSASELLDRVDEVLRAVKRNCQLVGDGITRPCQVCGLGNYQLIVDGDARDFGLNPARTSTLKVFTCSHCGHAQLFHNANRHAAWHK